MAMAVGSKGGPTADINVTPMIDVILVILIIFMIIVPALMAGFNAVPPEGQNIKAHPPEDEDQVLGIASDGQYYLNKQPIRNETLAERLKQIYDARTVDKILYVKADKGLKYGVVQDAIDIAAKNGVRVTGLITDQRPGTESTVEGDIPQPVGGKQ